MKIRAALSPLALLSIVSVLAPDARANGEDRPPNIVVVLADDLGWGDLGCYGHPLIRTPNLDRFAGQGVRFSQCYSACGVCSPSRSAILTGRTPYRNGVYRWIPEGHEVHLRSSEISIATLLQDAGYATCHSGKWHLNGMFNSPEQPQPNDHGFDHWLATQNNAAPSHKDPVNFVRNGKEVGPLEGYSALLVVEEAIDWLANHRDKNVPFYLQIWTHEPHLPIESDPKFMALYEGATDDPGVLQHHGNISQLDHAFGLLMDELERQNLTDSTLVIFTSDNGPEGDGLGNPDNPHSQRNRNQGSTGGLRGRKRDDFEGGIRVPGIVRWPGRIEPGTVSNIPVIGTDIFATICQVAGIPLPEGRVIDSVSMVPAFSGTPVERPIPLYWRTHLSKPECRVAMRIGDWKIVANVNLTEFLLFNVEDDPSETHDRSTDEPERLRSMTEELIRLNASIMGEGPDWWKTENDF